MRNKKTIYFFLVYTLIFTLPVLFFIFSRIPGKYSDTYQVWGKTLEFRNLIDDIGVFRTIKWQITNFRFTPIEIIGWLQKITNPFIGYNLSWLFSFWAAGLGMYLLVYYLTKSKLSAVISGVIFAFSPFHFTQAVSTNIGTMHYEWIPFYVLFLIRFLRNFKLKDFLLTLLFAFLIAVTEHQLLAFTVIFTILFLIAYFAKNSEIALKTRFWAYGLLGILLLYGSVRLLFGGLFDVSGSNNNYLDPGKDQVKRYSTDAIEFFIPSAFHPFWGDSFQSLRQDTQSNESGRQSNYIGYTVLFLSLISLLGIKEQGRLKIFFLFIGLFFSFLCLGPVLHWKGDAIDKIWMPYNLLYDHVPYWYIIRTVNRMYVISLLGFSVSAGFGLNQLFNFFNKGAGAEAEAEGGTRAGTGEKRRDRKKFITLVFLTLISLEYLSMPVPTLSLNYSSFYDDLKKEEGEFSIIDIPGATSYDYGSRLMFYDQIHRKKNLAGMDFARVIEGKWDFQRNTPIVEELLYILPTGGKPPSKEIINDYYYNLATKILNYYDVKYIVVSKTYKEDDKKFDGQSFENTIYFIEGQLDADRIYEDDSLIAYRINQSDHLNGWFLAMELEGDYWGGKEGELGSVARWAKNGAKMRLVNMSEESKNIRLNFDTRIKNLGNMEVHLNGTKQETLQLRKKNEEHVVLLSDVKPGNNEIIFRIFNLEGEPVNTLEFDRGVKFSNVTTLVEGER